MLRQDHDNHEVRTYSRVRQLVVDAGWLARRRHMIHGLVEVDVTEPRRLIREEREATGESLSFTAFALACVGRAVDEDRSVHAYRDWRNRLIVFDEADVVISIEIDRGAAKFPLVHIVRGINRRTARDIHAEIRAVQRTPTASPGATFIDLFPRLPTLLRRLG